MGPELGLQGHEVHPEHAFAEADAKEWQAQIDSGAVRVHRPDLPAAADRSFLRGWAGISVATFILSPHQCARRPLILVSSLLSLMLRAAGHVHVGAGGQMSSLPRCDAGAKS